MRRATCIIVLLVTAVFASVLSGCSEPKTTARSSSSDLERVGEFEGGVLYRTRGSGGKGSFLVLSIKGSWRQMGRQYGRLLKAPMHDFYDTVVTRHLAKTKGLNLADARKAGNELCAQQSPHVRELVAGMAETSGFSLEQQKLVSVLVHVADMKPGCSSMAAWRDYASGGPLVVGRNWDMGGPYRDYKKFLTVVVYNPAGSSHAVADVNYVGTISLQTGMTSTGVFLDVQNGQHSDPKEVVSRRMPTFDLFDLLLKSSSLGDVDSYLTKSSNLPQISLIINVADAKEDRVYEWATYDVKRRTADGLIASSNYFVDPSWANLPVVQKGMAGDWAKERLANLLALGKKYKGKIDAKQMMAIFDTTYSEGGATFPDFTAYQVVAVPAEKTLWLKGRDYSGWEKVDLRPLSI